MGALTGLRLGGGIAGLVAIIAAIVWLVATVHDRDRLAALDTGHRACTLALAGGRHAAPVAAVCDAPIVTVVAERDADRACDAALALKLPTDPYTLRMTCSAPVKVIAADVATLTANVADRDAQLVTARAGVAAAVTRGEARTAAANMRTSNAQAALSRAPIGVDGLVRCAGDCLRDLAGDPPAAVAARP